jgi:hypothetical protein
LLDVLDGLLDICADIDRGRFTRDTIFRGYTYYFKPQTLHRFGFTPRTLNLVEALVFGLGLTEMAVLNCISHRRWIPLPLHRVYIVQFSAEQLLSQRNGFAELRKVLKGDDRLQRAA